MQAAETPGTQQQKFGGMSGGKVKRKEVGVGGGEEKGSGMGVGYIFPPKYIL